MQKVLQTLAHPSPISMVHGLLWTVQWIEALPNLKVQAACYPAMKCNSSVQFSSYAWNVFPYTQFMQSITLNQVACFQPKFWRHYLLSHSSHMPHRSCFLDFIFVVCFMEKYWDILVSLVRLITCKRLRRKWSWPIRDANPAFPWRQKKNMWNHRRRGWKADEDSHSEPVAYRSTLLPLVDYAFLAAQQHKLLVKGILHFPFRVSISLPSVSNTFQICSPCERRTVNFPPKRNKRNLQLLLEKDLGEWKGTNPSILWTPKHGSIYGYDRNPHLTFCSGTVPELQFNLQVNMKNTRTLILSLKTNNRV